MFTRFGNYKYTLRDSTRRARHSRVKNDNPAEAAAERSMRRDDDLLDSVIGLQDR